MIVDESWQARVCIWVFSILMSWSNENKNCMRVDKSWQARVCMRVFSTLMSWSKENKSCMRVDESWQARVCIKIVSTDKYQDTTTLTPPSPRTDGKPPTSAIHFLYSVFFPLDFNVPPEYRINSYIREKLAPFKLSRYGEDVLFYLYYTNEGDILQFAAAAEL